MKRVLLSIALGLSAPFVFLLGAEPFEVRGRTSLKEILAGSVVLLLYSAVCGFWIARKLAAPALVRWPIPAATVLSMLVISLVIMRVEGLSVWLFQGLPILLSGSLGVAMAMLLLNRRAVGTSSSDAEPSDRARSG